MALYGINLLDSYDNKSQLNPLVYDKVVICALPGSGKTQCVKALNDDFSNARINARVLDLDFKINNYSEHQVNNITHFINTAMLDDGELDAIFTFPHMLNLNLLSLDINVCIVLPENIWELVARVVIRCAGGKLPYSVMLKLNGNLTRPFSLGDYEGFLGTLPFFTESDCRQLCHYLSNEGYDMRFAIRYCDHALEWLADWKKISELPYHPNLLSCILPKGKFLSDCFTEEIGKDDAHENN